MDESITKELRSVNAVTLTEMLASGKWDGYRAVFMSTTLRDDIADRIDERFSFELDAKQDEIDGLDIDALVHSDDSRKLECAKQNVVDGLKADISELQARLDASLPLPVDADGDVECVHEQRERVIRCRDCAHFHEWDAPEGHYETCDRGPSNNWVGEDGFCAWAEPKEES